MATTIRFRCYSCHRIHSVDPAAAGRRGRCLCGRVMVVPGASGNGTAADDAALPFAAPVDDSAPGESPRPPARPEPADPEARGGGVERGVESRPRGAGRTVAGVLEVLAAIAALGAGAVHAFHAALVSEGFRGLPGPDHLGIPGPFWATILFALAGVLLLDGRSKIRGA